MTRARRLGLVLGLVVLALTTWLVLRRPAGPSEADGEAWLAGFVEQSVGPRLLGAKGADALALFPGLGTWSADPCVTSWSRTDASAPIVTAQWLELGRYGDDTCATAQFGQAVTTLRRSAGIGPEALAERLTGLFGQPVASFDHAPDGGTTLRWPVTSGVYIQERWSSSAADSFTVTTFRGYGSPTARPTAAEAADWMDATVALLTGPALTQARGAAAVALVGGRMQAAVKDDDGCATSFLSDPLAQGPIVHAQTLELERAAGAPCEAAAFAWFDMDVWQAEPVTAAALVQRLGTRLGAPEVSRVFDRSGVTYVWRTALGTKVQLFEGLTGDWAHVLTLRTWRADP